MRKEINLKIIDVLRADATLKKDVKVWIYGLPKKTPVNYPIIFVKAADERKRLVGPRQYMYESDFIIGISHSHAKEDVAEKLVQDLIDQVEVVLNANLTLGGLVKDIVFGRGENAVAVTEKQHFLVEGHYFITCKHFVSRV